MLRKNRFVIISVHRSKCCGDMTIFRFFKMAAAAILDFQNFKLLTVRRLKRVELRRHAKFGRNRSKYGGDMTSFRFFKMAAAVILDFQNFNCFSCCSQPQHLSTVITRRRLQAGGGRRETESAPQLRPFSKIILFHFVMEPRMK